MSWNPGAGDPLDVALGVDAYRDAAAVIRALSVRDPEGAHVVMTGTDAPRQVALAAATIALHVCQLGGLDHDGISRLLAQITANAADFLLDETPLLPSDAGVHGG